jgi:hypothetical protein
MYTAKRENGRMINSAMQKNGGIVIGRAGGQTSQEKLESANIFKRLNKISYK